MRFTDPPGEAVVIDGEHVWIYTPSTVPGQVLRLAVPSGPVYGYNLLAWFLDKPAERYRASYLRSEKLDGRTTDVIQLVPAVPDLPFNRAVIWLDREDALPRRLEIHESSGATRMLRLTRLRVNEAVPKPDVQLQGSCGRASRRPIMFGEARVAPTRHREHRPPVSTRPHSVRPHGPASPRPCPRCGRGFDLRDRVHPDAPGWYVRPHAGPHQ